MKKFLLFFAAMFLFAGLVSSQTVLYQDNFDTYAVDSYLAVNNSTWWTTWDNTPGSFEDIKMKDAFSNSPSMSGLAYTTSSTKATDCILKLGNKVSGAYELRWYMYVPTGKCGYYNVQHMQSPGTEWAYEIYFRTDGSIELLEGGLTLGGTYPKDTWFEVKQMIDLDADNVDLFINGILLKSWPISNEAQNTGGTKQLGGVDFYAGAKSGTSEAPSYYIDDVYFAETVSGAVPIVGASPEAVSSWLVGGTGGNATLAVNNIGTAPLTFDVNVAYDFDNLKSSAVVPSTSNDFCVKRVLTKALADPSPNAGGAPRHNPDATAQIHYDGDNSSAIGWNTVPATATVAARFVNSLTLPYAGMDVTSVEVYINDLNTDPSSNVMKLRIYDMGNTFEPGPMLYEQEFTPLGASWNTITLTTPVKITGKDLWVGYSFTQEDASIFIPGTDGGPADPNGDFESHGVGWGHLAPAFDYNWNIRANLSGTVAPHWLTVAPLSGTVAPAENKPLTLTFSSTGLSLGQYHSSVKLLSNDVVTPVFNIPVTLDVVGVGINEKDNTAVMVYPNPAKENLNIVTNGTLKAISITDFNGKVVYKGVSQSIDLSKMSKGIYSVRVETAQGISNTKFVKD
jgi:hypothetical protein